MQNQFSVTPAGNHSEGLSGLGDVIAYEKEKRDQQKKVEAQEQRQRDMLTRYQTAAKSDDPMELVNLSVEYPEIQDQAFKAYGFKQDYQKKEAKEFASQILSNPQKAGEIAEQRIQYLQAQDRNPENTAEFLKKYQQDPEAALKELEGNFAITFPDEYKSFRDSTIKKMEGFSLSPGEARYDADGKLIVKADDKPVVEPKVIPPSGYRFKSNGDLEAIPGGPATKEETPTKAEVINIQKPDGTVQAYLATDTAGLEKAVAEGGVERGMIQPKSIISAKEIQTAKGKIQTAQLMKKQIADARARFEPIRDKGWMSGGEAGPTAWIYRAGEAGSNFDASIDGLRSTVTALTRTPGIGSMSDYEAKMDTAKLPDRKSGEYESTIMQKLDQLEQLADTIEIGYTGILADTESMAGNSPKQVGRFQVEVVE